MPFMSINQKKTDLEHLNEVNKEGISLETFIDLYRKEIFDKIGLPPISKPERNNIRYDDRKKMEIWRFDKSDTEKIVITLKNQIDKSDGINTGVRYGIYDSQTLLATFYIPEKT